MDWDQEDKCEKCIYYEVLSETEVEEGITEEIISCNCPKWVLGIWDISQCDFRTEAKPGEKIPHFGDGCLDVSDFGL